MRQSWPFRLSACLTVPALILVGCGGGGSASSVAVSVSVTPATVTVKQGDTQAFSATVSGSSNTAVTWSVQEGAAGGSISASGLYTAPATPGTYHVVATSSADGTRKATATVTVPQVSVTLSPGSATLSTDGTAQFSATVGGTVNTDVTWSVQEGNGGTVSSGGLYTAPATAGTYHVVATSAADTSKTASATLTVQQGVVVSLPTSAATLDQAEALELQATVTGSSNTAVTWSVLEGGGGGSISGSTYTAPEAAGVYHLRATSVADTSRHADMVITVRSLSVGIDPASATVFMGETRSFTGTLSGHADRSLVWSVVEGADGGTVSASGLYTAPATPGTYHVRATSVRSASHYAEAVVTVPSVAVSLNPGSVTLDQGATQAFSASITGCADTRVTWSVVEGATGGSISGGGTYTAPATPGTYHVRATSVADATRFAEAAVTVSEVSLSVSPASPVVQTGATQAFSATVSGTVNHGVTWSCSAGTISASGHYTAPASPASDVKVRATSVADSSKYAEATVTVSSSVGISISPTEATVYRNGAQTFRATIDGTADQRVLWSVTENGGGTVDSNGQYTAPAATGTYHLVARSLVDPAKSATATITVPTVGVSISPSQIDVYKTDSSQLAVAATPFTATVTGTANPNVTWSASGGSINNGLFTSSTYQTGSVTITAASQGDPSATGTATVKVNVVAVSITSPSATTLSLDPGGTQTFAATVAGDATNAITWSVDEAGGGTIDAAGNYVAPSAPGTYHVCATSTLFSAAKRRVAITVRNAGKAVRVTPPSTSAYNWSNGQLVCWVGGGTSSYTFGAATEGLTNTAVTWSTDAPSGVTISSSGMLSWTTAAVPGTYKVKATSVEDGTLSGEYTIVVARVPVIVSPASVRVPVGGTVSLTASSSPYSYTHTCTWAMKETGDAGSIPAASASSATYTAGNTPGTYTVRATWTRDTNVTVEIPITVVANEINLSLSPAVQTLETGQTINLNASLSGASNPAVSWAIQEGSFGHGTLSSSGLSARYTAPSTAGTKHVVVTSTQQTSVKAVATLTIVAAPVRVAMAPDTITVPTGGTARIAGFVSGNANANVTWSITEGAAGGTVADDGTQKAALYTAPAAPGTYHVVATSAASASATGTCTINVVDPGTIDVAILPRMAGTAPGGTVALAASLTGHGNSAVTWSADSGTVAGSANNLALYTAPATPGVYTVTATSVADGSRKASAMVVVRPGTAVNTVVAPNAFTILAGRSFPFSATVLNSPSSQLVSWFADNGSFTNNLYTAPALPVVDRIVASASTDSTATFQSFANVVSNPVQEQSTLSGRLLNYHTEGTATLLPNGKVLLVGGNVAGTGNLPGAELYDPEAGNGQGAIVASYTVNAYRTQHSATLLADGRVLIAGGYSGTATTASAEIFDPAANGGQGGFSTITGLPAARRYHTATLLPDGKVLLAGGWDGSGNEMTSAVVFNPSDNSWTATTNTMLVKRYNHRAVLLPNGKVLISGGGSNYGTVASCELYDPATGAFDTVAPAAMKAARQGHVLIPLGDGRILAAFGNSGGAETYNPQDGTWTLAAGGAASGVSYSAGALLKDGRVAIFGGEMFYAAGPEVYFFDPVQNMVYPALNGMVSARKQHNAVVLPGGKVLIVGGYNASSNNLFSYELYQ